MISATAGSLAAISVDSVSPYDEIVMYAGAEK